MAEFEPTVRVAEAAEAPPAPAAQSPTQAVIADANRVVFVTDAAGRKIGVRRMSMSVRRRTLKAITPESQTKDRYMGLVMLAACVVSIDGVPYDPLASGGNEVRFDGLIDLLDDHGFEAVATAIERNFGSGDDAKK